MFSVSFVREFLGDGVLRAKVGGSHTGTVPYYCRCSSHSNYAVRISGSDSNQVGKFAVKHPVFSLFVVYTN